MARGYLSGLIWGSVVSLGGAAVVSMSTPLPQAPDVVSAQPAVSEPDIATTSPPVPEAVPASTADASAQPVSPAAPEGDSLTALDAADTTPAAAPTVGAAAPLAETVDPEVKPPSVAISTEPAPVVVADATSPSAPVPAEDLTISTEPAQPTPPPSVAETSGFGEADTTEAPQDADGVEEETSDVAASPAADTAVDEAEAAPAPEPEPAPAAEPRVADLPRVEDDTSEDTTEEIAQDSTEEADTPAATPTTTAPSPSIGQRVAPITERDTAAVSLPTVGADTDTASAETPANVSAEAPIAAFAAPFSNPDDKPLMGTVLMDDASSIGAEALETFPYPLTFAIDPFDPDAAEKMARYRAAGFEVLVLMDLPLTATPEDAESTFEVALATLNETIGVLEGVGSGVQGSRALSDQVTAILRDKGYGFITQNSGLNTVQKLAEREGVPSAYVFRDFDGAGQTPTVMRRFLDQAAFRAGQEGGVIMLGRVRPDTISALLLWGLQDRASRVALAPASAVLTAQPQAQ